MKRSTIKTPTLKMLAAKVQKLEARIEDLEDALEFDAILKRDKDAPKYPWEQVKKELERPVDLTGLFAVFDLTGAQIEKPKIPFRKIIFLREIKASTLPGPGFLVF